MDHAVEGHEETDCGFFCVCLGDQMVTRLDGSLDCLCQKAPGDSDRWMTGVEDGWDVRGRGSSVKGLANRVEGNDLEQSHRGREMTRAPDVTRVEVAIVRNDQSYGRYGDDDHGLDGVAFPDRDETRDLCAGLYHGDRDPGRHSTGLSTPDSFGIQPWRRRQRHLDMNPEKGSDGRACEASEEIAESGAEHQACPRFVQAEDFLVGGRPGSAVFPGAGCETA